ncbi:hypothetical protein BDV12DRAFT_161695 [Aspergillus spectabilis]
MTMGWPSRDSCTDPGWEPLNSEKRRLLVENCCRALSTAGLSLHYVPCLVPGVASCYLLCFLVQRVRNQSQWRKLYHT